MQVEGRLKLPYVVAVSISSMLGSGIFVLPGLAAAKTGSAIWLAYLAAALCVLPAALSKSELASAIPSSGGSYVYIDRTFGPLAGTIAGLGLWVSLLLKGAFALVGLAAYLHVVADVPGRGAALFLLIGIVTLNIRGVRGVSRVQMAVVSVSILTLAGISAGAWFAIPPVSAAPLFPHGAMGFASATGFVFVSYAGVTKVAAIAEEIHRPERNVPLGILLSLGIAAVLYAGVAFVLVRCIPMELLQADLRPIHTLAVNMAGPAIGAITAVIGVATMASMANAGLMAASRFPFAMSRDHHMPSVFGRLHNTYLTPTASVVASGLLVAAAIISFDVERIAKLASSFMIMIFVAECAAVIVLREAGVQWYKPAYRSPWYPIVQIVGAVVGIGLLAVMGGFAVTASLGLALPGAALFLLYGRRRIERRGVVGQRGRRLDLLRPPEAPGIPLAGDGSHDQIPGEADAVVSLFGTERCPEMLVELAGALCDGGKTEVLHLTELPEQTSFSAVLDGGPRVSSIRRRVLATALDRTMEVHFDAVTSRDIVHSVHEISSRLRCRWLVMQWGGRQRGTFTVSNPIGWLKDHVDSNLAVFYDAGVRYIRSVLVYVEPGSHDSLVANTADRFARVNGGELTFLCFLDDALPGALATSQIDYINQVRALCASPSEIMVLRGRAHNMARIVGEASAGFDLLVTAEDPQRSVWTRIRGTRADRLTQHAACSVLRLQSPRGRTHEPVDAAMAESARHELISYVGPDCIAARLDITRKDALFSHCARTFAETVPGVDHARILAALWKREREQNTSVGMGLALPHATLPEAQRTYLGIFTTRTPVDYGAPDGKGTDVFFVTIGAPSDRQTHLILLAAISRVVSGTPLLERMRQSRDVESLVHAVDSCCKDLDVDLFPPALA